MCTQPEGEDLGADDGKQGAGDQRVLVPRATEDAPQKVLVAESSLEAAQFAIEAMTDADELLGDA